MNDKFLFSCICILSFSFFRMQLVIYMKRDFSADWVEF